MQDDLISRQAVLDIIEKEEFKGDALSEIEKLPSVNPQKSKEGYISIDNVMSVFDDFMCGEVDEDGTEIFLEMLKDKAESEDKE